MDTVIVFPIYPGVTHLDFTGPHQVLARLPGATTIVASIGGEAVSVDGLTFANLAKLEAVERCDVLCVPGGFGCVDAMRSDAFLSQIRRLAVSARYVTSVCTGSLILAAAGLLEGKRAACHWACRDQLALFGAIPDPGRVVRDGNVFTGGGVTAGIDFALTLAAELADETVAQAIQLSLEYAPAPPYDSGRPETAAPEIVELVTARNRARMPDRQAIVEQVAAALRRI
ncbi:DJ-1/PfpI family protein [Mycobacterium sp. KBS0706]|uniref:DJ-1/PfpI family protein n=1 Tax=Mycobacterium sp. KBS0706 TaxID=2578109 RepID=UPI00110FB97D|nr:DJ-1/PfpI family protein [Mycobacterium sp. KBS0706]TSD86670.1 DJ-1/PfpI family protein [Mycobacterium sp. KBS0706]